MTVEKITMRLAANHGRCRFPHAARAPSPKGCAFSSHSASEIPRRSFRATRSVLKQVLINLLGNAHQVHRARRNSHAGLVRIATADSSTIRFRSLRHRHRHVAMSRWTALFQPFTQADESTTRKFGGTGPGPHHQQAPCGVAGRRITVRIQRRRRQHFRLSIDGGPLDGVRHAQGPHRSDARSADCRPRSRPSESHSAAAFCWPKMAPTTSAAFPCTCARPARRSSSPRTAASRSIVAQSQPFDLILMDMQMPELDGYGATSELRTRGSRCRSSPSPPTPWPRTGPSASTPAAPTTSPSPSTRCICSRPSPAYLPGSTTVAPAPASAAPANGHAALAHLQRSTMADDPDMKEALADSSLTCPGGSGK